MADDRSLAGRGGIAASSTSSDTYRGEWPPDVAATPGGGRVAPWLPGLVCRRWGCEHTAGCVSQARRVRRPERRSRHHRRGSPRRGVNNGPWLFRRARGVSRDVLALIGFIPNDSKTITAEAVDQRRAAKPTPAVVGPRGDRDDLDWCDCALRPVPAGAGPECLRADAARRGAARCARADRSGCPDVANSNAVAGARHLRVRHLPASGLGCVDIGRALVRAYVEESEVWRKHNAAAEDAEDAAFIPQLTSPGAGLRWKVNSEVPHGNPQRRSCRSRAGDPDGRQPQAGPVVRRVLR